MLSVARNTIVSHSKGLQKQIERRVTISASAETISEKTEVKKVCYKVSFEVDISDVQ
jgi:hypothetical protein